MSNAASVLGSIENTSVTPGNDEMIAPETERVKIYKNKRIVGDDLNKDLACLNGEFEKCQSLIKNFNVKVK